MNRILQTKENALALTAIFGFFWNLELTNSGKNFLSDVMLSLSKHLAGITARVPLTAIFQVRFGKMPKPARETRALPKPFR